MTKWYRVNFQLNFIYCEHLLKKENNGGGGGGGETKQCKAIFIEAIPGLIHGEQ